MCAARFFYFLLPSTTASSQQPATAASTYARIPAKMGPPIPSLPLEPVFTASTFGYEYRFLLLLRVHQYIHLLFASQHRQRL